MRLWVNKIKKYYLKKSYMILVNEKKKPHTFLIENNNKIP